MQAASAPIAQALEGEAKLESALAPGLYGLAIGLLLSVLCALAGVALTMAIFGYSLGELL